MMKSSCSISMQEVSDPQSARNRGASDLSVWFPTIKPHRNARLRLICFPYAGAGTAVFRAWPDTLTEAIEVRVAQLPGRSARLREDRHEQMPPLIETLAKALRPLLDRPFAFFGHSLGALVAFELARELRRQALAPIHLFVSGHIAPDLPNPAPLIHELPQEAFLRELQSLNGMPQAVLESKELLEIVLPAVRSDFTLLETYEYVPQPPLGCPITAFGGLQDPRTSKRGLESWRSQTIEKFDLVMLEGDHFFIDTSRPVLLDSLARRLSEKKSVCAGWESTSSCLPR
jgi:medium-chain acyl-[acyl-carrier-protein] hydrolase